MSGKRLVRGVPVKKTAQHSPALHSVRTAVASALHHAAPQVDDAASHQETKASIYDPNTELYIEVIKDGLNAVWPEEKKKKVLIIGAGLAGLAAAASLKDAGHHVEILEATQRVGGRVYTLRTPFYENHAEAGAMRLPKAHRVVQTYVKKYELPTEIFHGFNPKGYVYIFGTPFNIGEYSENPLKLHNFLVEKHGYKLNQELLGNGAEKPITIGDFWENALQELLKESGFYKDQEKAWEYMCNKYDVSYGEYLTNYANPKWEDGTMELFGLIGSGIGGYQSTYGASFLENVREALTIRDDIKDQDSVTFVEIKGGNDQLASAIVNDANLSHHIRFGAKVTKVHRCADGKFTISYIRTAQPQLEFHVTDIDHVVSAVTFPALRAIDIQPPFSTEKQRAIRELHYQQAGKIMVQFSDRFWTDPNGPLGFVGGGAISTDLPVKNIYFPDHGKESGRGVVLASYVWEDDALYWASKPVSQQVREALAQVRQIILSLPNPRAKDGKPLDIAPLFEVGDAWSWTLDAFTSGAYAYFAPGQMSTIFEAIVQEEHNFHFAGEHASFDHAWIEGALESGVRAAIEIHTAHH